MIANRGNFRHVAYAFKTDVGKKRKNNEDALGAFPEGGIFCVADGMGGGDDGEIASAAVVKAVDDVSRRCSTGAGHDAKDVAAVLEAGLSDASAWRPARYDRSAFPRHAGAVYDPECRRLPRL